jgi:hypothetical protein
MVLPGIKRGAGGIIAGFGQVASDATGGAVGQGAVEYGQELQRDNPARVQGFKDLTLGTAPTFVGESIAEQVPQVPLTMAGAAAGAKAGALLGPKGAVIGGVGGALLGRYLPSLIQSQGQIRQEDIQRAQEEGTPERGAWKTLPYAAVAGGLDMLGVNRAAAGALKDVTGAGKRLAADESRLKHMGKEALRTGKEEAPTEFAQNIIEDKGAGKSADLEEAAFAGLKGAAGGAGIGGAMGIFTPQDKAAIKAASDDLKNATMADLGLEGGPTPIDMDVGEVGAAPDAVDVTAPQPGLPMAYQPTSPADVAPAETPAQMPPGGGIPGIDFPQGTPFKTDQVLQSMLDAPEAPPVTPEEAAQIQATRVPFALQPAPADTQTGSEPTQDGQDAPPIINSRQGELGLDQATGQYVEPVKVEQRKAKGVPASRGGMTEQEARAPGITVQELPVGEEVRGTVAPALPKKQVSDTKRALPGLPPKVYGELEGKDAETQAAVLQRVFHERGGTGAKVQFVERIPALFKQLTGRDMPLEQEVANEQDAAQGAGRADAAQDSQGAQPVPGPVPADPKPARRPVKAARPAEAGPAQEPQQEEVASPVAAQPLPVESSTAPAAAEAAAVRAERRAVPAPEPIAETDKGEVSPPADTVQESPTSDTPKTRASEGSYQHVPPTLNEARERMTRAEMEKAVNADPVERRNDRRRLDWWSDIAWAKEFVAKSKDKKLDGRGNTLLKTANEIIAKTTKQDLALAEKRVKELTDTDEAARKKRAAYETARKAPKSGVVAERKPIDPPAPVTITKDGKTETVQPDLGKVNIDPIAKRISKDVREAKDRIAAKEEKVREGIRTKRSVSDIVDDWLADDDAWDGANFNPKILFHQQIGTALAHQTGVEPDVEVELLAAFANAKDGNVPVEEALRIVERTARNPEHRQLAKKVRELALRLKSTAVFAHSFREGIEGATRLSRGAFVDAPNGGVAVLFDTEDGDVSGFNAHTVLHEAMHALTVRAVKYGEQLDKNPKRVASDFDRRILDAYQRLEKLRADAQAEGLFSALSEEDTYGFEDAAEFISEAWSNRNLQEFLKRLPTEKRSSTFKSVWDSIVDAVRSIFGMSPRDTNVLNEVLTLTPEFFNLDGKVSYALDPVMHNATGGINHGPGGAFDNVGQAVKDLSAKFEEVVKSTPYSKWVTLKDAAQRAFLYATTQKNMVYTFGNRFPALKAIDDVSDRLRGESTRRNNESSALAIRVKKWVEANGNWSPSNPGDPKVPGSIKTQSQILYNLAEQSTVEHIDPRQPIEKQQGFKEASAKGRTGDTWNEFAKAYGDVKSLHERLNPEGRKLYADMVDHNRRMYDDFHEQAVRSIARYLSQEKVPEGMDLKELTKLLRSGALGGQAKAAVTELDRNHANMQGPYFHLGRFGEYFVKWNDGEGTVFEMYETAGEMQAREDELKAQKVSVESAGKIAERVAELDSGSSAFVKSMIDRIEDLPNLDEHQRKLMQASVRQLYLQMLPETSSRRVYAKRKNVAGWNRDVLRNFVKRAEIGNYNTAYAMHARDMAEGMQSLKDQIKDLEKTDSRAAVLGRNIEGELRKRQANQINTPHTPAVDMANALTYNFYLAFSPAYILTNLIQPTQVSLPLIGSKYGFAKTAIELARSTKTAFKIAKATAKADWKYPDIAVDKLVKEKILSEEQGKFLSVALARGRIDLTLAHELGQVKKAGGVSKINDLQHVLGLGSHYSEVINRIATGLTAFNMARGRGVSVDEATSYANRMVDETQLDYTAENLARFMGKHGPLGTLTPIVMAFQRYNAQMLELFGRQTMEAAGGSKEARKALIGMFAMTGAMAGTMGLPFANVVFAVMDKLFGDEDEPFDAKAEYRNALANTFGKGVAEVIARGGPRALGVNMSRVGMEDLLPFTRLLGDKREMKEVIQARGIEMMGPLVGGVQNMFLGMGQMADGDVAAGLGKAFPIALGRNIAKAAEMAGGYAVDSKGNRIPVAIDGWNIANQAMGFTPPELAERSEALYTINTRNRQLEKRASELRQQTYRAYDKGDAAKVADLQLEIMKFNQANPMFAVSGLGQGYAQRKREENIARTVGPGVGVTSMKRLPTLDIGRFANVRDEEDE